MRSRTPNEEELLLRGTRDHYEDAALYDFEYEDRGVDIVWYRRLAARLGVKQRILEPGAGTGRITVPLLEAGHVVTALDKMPPMLELLQAKAAASPSFGAQLAVVVGDMTALPLADGAFDLVIAPFNALQHLYSYRELLACFCEARRVLAPGGTFAFDVLLPDLDWLTWDPDERHAVTHFKHPTTGSRWCILDEPHLRRRDAGVPRADLLRRRAAAGARVCCRRSRAAWSTWRTGRSSLRRSGP